MFGVGRPSAWAALAAFLLKIANPAEDKTVA